MVVEDAEGGDGDEQDEDWEGAQPRAIGIGERGEGAVGAAGQEGAGGGERWGDEAPFGGLSARGWAMEAALAA